MILSDAGQNMKGVTRPKMTTLPEAAQIPPRNLRRPPSRYTHRLIAEQPYFYEAVASGNAPGTFGAGTRVARDLRLSAASVRNRWVKPQPMHPFTKRPRPRGIEPPAFNSRFARLSRDR